MLSHDIVRCDELYLHLVYCGMVLCAELKYDRIGLGKERCVCMNSLK